MRIINLQQKICELQVNIKYQVSGSEHVLHVYGNTQLSTQLNAV